ncbi:MAG: acetyl-CoA carboxylase carboxyltransferase subunit alpha [PVC group bacterium]
MKKRMIESMIQELMALAERDRIDIGDEIIKLQEKITAGDDPSARAWARVLLARHSERPTALDLINRIADRFLELHGDRNFADDPALIGGIGIIDGVPVTFLGHQKGRNLKENLKRNYGMAHPEGYRKACRLALQAEKFGRPIIAFIDTPGAYPGIASEERGIGEAIARNLKVFSAIKTPIICVITGEGGSGGALGIGVGDRLLMLENAIYSVISPEGCAAILLKNAGEARSAAALLKLTAPDLLRFGIIDGIIPEPPGGAHRNIPATADAIKEQLLKELQVLRTIPLSQLLKSRGEKLHNPGRFHETTREPREGLVNKFMTRIRGSFFPRLPL